MELETFFEQFELLADAPNGVQKLRQLILQLAVQGKLVPQDSNDEPASVLLERIREEKKRLVKEGKIKKSLKLPPVAVDEISLELPSSWLCICLGECIELISGQHLGKNEQNEKGEGLPYLTGPADFGEVNPTATRWTVTPKAIAKKNDVLITVKGAGVGKSNILGLDEAAIGRQLMAIRPILVEVNYVYVLVLASYDKFQALGTGSTVPGISREDILNFIFPLPPLAEQKRIVAKVDRLMALCDELEARQEKQHDRILQLGEVATSQLLTPSTPEAFNQHWQGICDNFDLLYSTPENVSQLRQAILQLAVMGKLVPQDANDEPTSVLLERIEEEKVRLVKEGKIKKSEKLLPVDVDEMPFELPNGWGWSNLLDVTSSITDGEHQTPTRINVSEIPLATAKNIRDGYLDLTNTDFVSYETAEKCWNRCKPMHNDILMVCVGATTGRVCLVKQPPQIVIVRSVALIRPFERYIYPEYIALFLKSPLSQTQIWNNVKQSAQPCLYINKMQILSVPVPPINEQKRIIAKVDRLMSLCDELEAKLTQSINDREKLMETAVRQVLAA